MKPLTFALAAMLLLLTACPKGGGGSSTATSSTSSTTTAPPPPPEPVIIPAGTLDWDGWQLGTDWTDASAKLGTDVEFIETWTEKPKLGQVIARPKAGGDLPEEVLVFLDSQLVGYNYSNYMAIEQFGNLKAELAGLLGEPAVEPPAWAMESPYFEGYREPIKEVEFFYWDDEAARAVLCIIFNSITDLGVVSLANVDHFKEANERIASSPVQETPTDTVADAESKAEEPGAVFGEVAVTTACDFILHGHKLGDSYTLVKEECPDDGTLIISQMWAVEEQTGMCGANPSDLSTPYPAIAAWFLKGALAGYIRTEDMTRDEFIAATDEFDMDYGAGLFDPPEWYLNTPDGKNYVAPDSDTEQLIWPDEANQAILFAQYNFKENIATFMLFDTYAYTKSLDETMGSLGYGEPGEQ